MPRRGASSGLTRRICEANMAGSFAKASGLLQSLAGLSIGAKRVQLTVEGVGEVLQDGRDAQTARYLQRACPPPAPAQPIPLLVVSADGGRVQTRSDDPDRKWRENKIGLVYDALPCPQKRGEKYKGPAPVTRSLVATMGSWESLGEHLSACAERRGDRHAGQVLFVSDGAQAIRTLRQDCFPQAVFVLDWKHAMDNLRRAATAALGVGEKADRWYKGQETRLWEGRTDQFLRRLSALLRRIHPPGRKEEPTPAACVVAQVIDYFRTNRAGLDYPLYRSRGWPLASCQVESTIKQMGKRVKGSERHWSLRGVEHTMQVSALLIANDGGWDRFWKRHIWADRTEAASGPKRRPLPVLN
jgi:hypothetical protein